MVGETQWRLALSLKSATDSFKQESRRELIAVSQKNVLSVVKSERVSR